MSENNNDILQQPEENSSPAKETKKQSKFSQLSVGKKAGMIVAVIAVIVILVGGIYCGVTEQSPVQAINTAFGANNDKLIGNWESDANPGFSAYVFNEDGTCDQYVLTAVFHWDYEVKGNKLSMVNKTTSKENVYRITVSGDKLTMTLIVQDDVEVDNGDTLAYNKVEELHQKTLTDVLQNMKQSEDTTSE